MNKFYKYAPNAWVAETDQDFTKGEEITMTNRHGKEKPYMIWNLLHSKEKTRSGKNYYSITPIENKNYYEKKAERTQNAIKNSLRKAEEYYEKSNKDSAFLSLAEPIKIGHHSEKRHRKIIEQAHKNTDKWVEYRNKAKSQSERLEYYESMKDNINLSKPESLEFYQNALIDLKETHQFYLKNPDKREHSFSLTYAKKAVNECEKNLEIAIKLWG